MIGFRVPYMPEGMQFADFFDTYTGTLRRSVVGPSFNAATRRPRLASVTTYRLRIRLPIQHRGPGTIA